MLHEIEGVEREIRSREDQILAEMEKAETLTAEVKSEEEAFKEREERHKTRRARRWTSAARVLDGGRRAARRGARRRWRQGLAEDTLELFQRVAKLRGIGRGGGARRHVPGLPREAAPADVRRTSSATKRSCSAPPATASSITSRPCPSCTAAVTRPDADDPLHIHIDGGSRGNPGDAGFGVYVDRAGRRRGRRALRLPRAAPPTTSPSTRRCSTPCATPWSAARGGCSVFSDSELVVRQIGGQLPGEAPGHDPAAPRGQGAPARASRRPASSHVRREQNKDADRLANQALDEKARSSTRPSHSSGGHSCLAGGVRDPSEPPPRPPLAAPRPGQLLREPHEADHPARAFAFAAVRVVQVGAAHRCSRPRGGCGPARGRPARAGGRWRRARRGGACRAGRAGRTRRRRGRTRPAAPGRPRSSRRRSTGRARPSMSAGREPRATSAADRLARHARRPCPASPRGRRPRARRTRVHEQDGQAIRGLDAEDQPGLVRDGRVRFRPPVPRRGLHAASVHLLEQLQPAGVRERLRPRGARSRRGSSQPAGPSRCSNPWTRPGTASSAGWVAVRSVRLISPSYRQARRRRRPSHSAEKPPISASATPASTSRQANMGRT